MLVDKKSITSIAIGGFDGMHMAHQTLFANLTKNGAIVVIETGYANLTPKTKREAFTSYPIYYYDLQSIKHLQGKEFMALLNEEFPNMRKIVVGFDFCFGANRTHCISELKELFHGEVVVINEVCINNIPVHSRIIREYIVKGDFLTANTLLGRKYTIDGVQVKGQGLGSKSFVPTINLKVEDYLLPNEGVYATKTIVEKQSYESITFLGHRVTTDGSFAIETHILDKNLTNHRKEVQIKFFEKIRDNQKFDSFEDLKLQIDQDIIDVKNYFQK
ncbi:bifunctional riboflavin kinase/FAD synthetase [Candidatus Marinarcus aquaticus]|uniref:Riboflavin biosynthesis protein n=1 Tax=Candidatus Marinarcus aquaticus TaxID=2044504 RepID=A0A4V1LNQ4_9BACT|nr:bifunctional riboflavin kinase/FAD synthetase [Candidatus Marinarcus aquaticus]RXJ55227.1 bifunctional riboflavin kinase/FAD synthetase [Candidatus Marinarcus aquaticus]